MQQIHPDTFDVQIWLIEKLDPSSGQCPFARSRTGDCA